MSTAPTGTPTTADTATTTAARDNARSRGGELVDAMRFIPPTLDPAFPADLDAETVTWAENIPAGGYTTAVISRGTRVRLNNRDGSGCANLMLWRADAPHDRLSVADSMKIPWQAYLGDGHPLLSDQGRLLATIVDDTTGGKADAICGTTTAAANSGKYGEGDPIVGQAQSEAPAGRELLVLAAAKNGLDPRDVPPTVSFFHGVRVTDTGELESTGDADAGAVVEFIAHAPLIVAVANTAHPIDDRVPMPTTTISLHAWESPETLQEIAADLPNRDPEYLRAWQNTEADIRARYGRDAL